MKRYLVTGGAGFIGSWLVGRLAKAGHEVDILDLPERQSRVASIPHTRYLAGDIRDERTFARLEGCYDAVCHLAAQVSARVSQEQPMLDVDTNVRGSVALLEWCAAVGVTRLLFASSMGVYGNVPEDKLPVAETAPPNPVSYYGVAKSATEAYIATHREHGLRSTIFRMFNVYGPGQDLSNSKQGIVGIYTSFALKGVSIDVTGSLERFRDLIYVEDVVDAWVAALENPVTEGKIYNLASGRRTTVRALITSILRAMGHDPATYPVKEIGGHRGDQFGVQADISLALREIGWQPRTELDEGIARMVAWARAQ